MAYWNHFSEQKYRQIKFADIPIGDKFRKDFFKGKRRRKDIICIKTGELTYIEQRSKKARSYLHLREKEMVSSYTKSVGCCSITE